MSSVDTSTWTTVCRTQDVIPDTGVCVLVDDQQIAVFRLRGPGGDEWYAVGNYCPFAGAQVISRGLVGSQGDIPTVASPIYKQRFDLRSGCCIDQPEITLKSWPVRVRGEEVAIGARYEG